MKKYLLFIISVFILVFSLSSCDTSDLENEYHDFHVAYNDEGHYDLCDCGHKEHEEEHIFSGAIHMIQKESCSQEGIYEYHCIGCDYTKEVRIDKLPHEFGDWETTVEATCLNQGQQKRVCKNCGYEEFKDTNKAPHTAVAYDTVDADCTHEGYTGGTYCSVCREELTEKTIIDKKDHSFGEWITVDAPTCTSIGSAERECSVCGHKEYKTLEKLPHTAVTYTDLEANCQHEGHTGGTYCSVCNQELTPYTIISKTGHDYTNWEQTSAPTCISIGQERRECTVCGHEEFRDVEKTAHIPTPGEAKASTCIEHGHTEGSYCSFCHAKLEAQEELPYSEHNYSIETITKEATINSEGVLTHTCSVCGDSYTTPIARKELTQLIWANSFKASEFKNHFVDFYYADKTLNKSYDITIIYKDNIKYVKLIDNSISKVYEYWYNGSEIIESCVDGYRHKAFEDMPDTDMYLKWFDLTLNNGVYFASFAYDKVEFKSDNGGYFIGNGVETRNYKGNTETASIGISFSDDEKLTGFTYSSDKYDICIFEIGTAPSITIPTATHHHIVDGKCDVCNLEYYTYTQTVNNIQLSYYVNKNNKNVDFDYSLLYSNQADVTFLYPAYSENGNIKKFITHYYEGTTPYISKTVKSFTINSKQLLKITYSDNSIERLLLLNDNTAVAASKDTDYSNNPYNGSVVGKTFEYVTTDYIYKYYIKSDSEIEITRYKEVCYYNINGTEITGFNRNLEKVIGYLEGYGSGKDTKHDGSKGTVYFQLNSDLSLDIWYEGFGSSSCNAFNTVTFQSITGYYINGKRDIYVYFRGDNVDYVMHYDTNNTITIAQR